MSETSASESFSLMPCKAGRSDSPSVSGVEARRRAHCSRVKEMKRELAMAPIPASRRAFWRDKVMPTLYHMVYNLTWQRGVQRGRLWGRANSSVGQSIRLTPGRSQVRALFRPRVVRGAARGSARAGVRAGWQRWALAAMARPDYADLVRG